VGAARGAIGIGGDTRVAGGVTRARGVPAIAVSVATAIRIALPIALAGALAIPAALTTNCGRRAASGAAADIDITWTLSRRTVGPATLTLTLRDAAGAGVPGATVRVEGHMTHPGMTPILTTAADRAGGVYQADVEFTMAGDWVLLVTAALPDGRRVERRIDVANVRPAG
jgi:hypothetical protein